jgi:hypothetical protein
MIYEEITGQIDHKPEYTYIAVPCPLEWSTSEASFS